MTSDGKRSHGFWLGVLKKNTFFINIVKFQKSMNYIICPENSSCEFFLKSDNKCYYMDSIT